jgi:hypothetical protein
MSSVPPNAPLQNEPTPDNLVGIPACREEEQPSLHERGRGDRVRKNGGKKRRNGTVVPLVQRQPTPDELAGIPVSAEANEELTVRPRRPRRQS